MVELELQNEEEEIIPDSQAQPTPDPGITEVNPEQKAQPISEVVISDDSGFEIKANPSQDDILQYYISKDLIPSDERYLKAIKNGQVKLDRVIEEYAGWKKSANTISKDGSVNEPSDLKSAAKEELSFTDKVQKNLGSIWERDIAVVNEVASKAFTRPKQIAQKFLTGVNFGIVYDPKIDYVDNGTAFAGVMADMVGQGVGIYLASTGITTGVALAEGVSFLKSGAQVISKGLKAYGKFKQNAFNKASEKAASKIATAVGEEGASVFKLARKVIGAKAQQGLEASIATIPEQAALGATVEGAKAAVNDKPFSDVLMSSIIGSVAYPVMGTVAAPVLSGGVAAMGMAFSGGKRFVAGKVLEHQAKKEFKKLFPKSEDIGNMLDYISSKPNKTDSDIRVLDAAKKISVLEPTMGPFPESEILSNPELMSGLTQAKAQQAVEELYINGQFRSLYDSSPALQKLIQNGNYIDALVEAQSYFRKSIKDIPTLGELSTSVFVNTPKTISDVLALQAERRLGNQGTSRSRSLISNFLMDPTDATLKPITDTGIKRGELSNALGISTKKVLGKGLPAFNDVRLSAQKADMIAGDLTLLAFESLSNKGGMKLGEIPTLSKSDSIIKAAIVYNKDLNRSFMDSYLNWDTSQQGWMKAPVEIADHVFDQINSQRMTYEIGEMMAKKRELSLQMTALKHEIKSATPAVGNLATEGASFGRQATAQSSLDNLNLQLSQVTQDYTALTGKIGRYANEIAGIETKINSLPDALKSEVYDFASQVRIPKASISLGKDQAVSTSKVLEGFGYKENPNYIKAGSELDDFMNALVVAGEDTRTGKGLGLSSNDVKAPLVSTFRKKAQRLFGYNNPLEKFFFHKYDEMKGASVLEKGKFINKIREIGIRANSREDTYLRRFVEGKLMEYDQEFLDLPKPLQEKLIFGKESYNSMTKELFSKINAVRQANNIPLVGERMDYVPHLGESDAWGELTNRVISGIAPEKLNDGGEGYLVNGTMYSIQKFKNDQGVPYFRFSKPRTESIDEADLMGAVGALEKYLDPAMDQIFLTNTVRELEAARNFAPMNLGIMLNKMKYQILGLNPDGLSYTREVPSGVRKGLSAFRQTLSEGYILGNIKSMYQNVISAGTAFAYSPKDAMVAVSKMFTPESNALWAKSNNAKVRNPPELNFNDPDWTGFWKIARTSPILDNARAARMYMVQGLKAAYSIFDEVAAKITFGTGVQQMLKAGATDEKQIIAYADALTSKLQGSFGSVDKPELMKQFWGKSLAQFQSFSMNMFTTMMTDIPMMVETEGAQKAVNLILRTYATASLTNEIAEKNGMPPPLDIGTWIPFLGNTRFGMAGLPGLAYETISKIAKDEDIANTDKQKTKLFKSFGKELLASTIPGGNQVFKTSEAILNDEDREGLPKSLRGPSTVFGLSAERSIFKKRKKDDKKPKKIDRSENPFLKARRKAINKSQKQKKLDSL